MLEGVVRDTTLAVEGYFGDGQAVAARLELRAHLAELTDEERRTRTRYLPDNIYSAIRDFKSSKWSSELLGEEQSARFAEIKQMQADRCPKELGSLVKREEIQFHHEVTNQYLWSQF